MENSQKIQWQPLVEMIVVLVTIIGSTIPLYMHIDNKTNLKLDAIQAEIRDFHGRLCAIEERNRGKN